jgi:DNA-binding protein YbaB
MAWDYHALQAEIDTAVEKYAAALARERATARVGPVTAVLRLDGVLADLVIDPRATHDALAEVITEALRAAEREVAGRREALASRVTFLGHPVLAMVQEMTSDPRAVARRLAASAEI